MIRFFSSVAIIATLMGSVTSQAAFAQQSGVGIDGWIPSTQEESDSARGGLFFVPVVYMVGRVAVTTVVKCATKKACRDAAKATAKAAGSKTYKVLETAVTLEGARSIACRYTGKLC